MSTKAKQIPRNCPICGEPSTLVDSQWECLQCEVDILPPIAQQEEWNPLDVDDFEFKHNDPELCCRVVDKDDWDKMLDLWKKTVVESTILQYSYNALRAELEELKRTTYVRAAPRFDDEARFPTSFQPKRFTEGTEIGQVVDLEPISSVAERVFPQEMKEIRSVPHIDSDRIQEDLWGKECNESMRLNRQGYV